MTQMWYVCLAWLYKIVSIFPFPLLWPFSLNLKQVSLLIMWRQEAGRGEKRRDTCNGWVSLGVRTLTEPWFIDKWLWLWSRSDSNPFSKLFAGNWLYRGIWICADYYANISLYSGPNGSETIFSITSLEDLGAAT